MDRYVILDRDGVINEDSDAFIKSPQEWLPIPGSLEAIALLCRNGFRVVVITNQSGIARGLLTEAMLEAIHEKMRRLTLQAGGEIAAIYYCPHGPASACSCRKPKSGLFQTFAQDRQVDLANIYAVGDSLRDLQASQAVGGLPILVKTGKGRKTLLENPQLNLPIFENLYDAASFIVATR
jgi:D-glycero-D-manno-heptose 1,7-bisphosphate phosphatase